MSTIKCPECKKKISNKIDTCPNCGYPIPLKKQHIKKKIIYLLILLFFICLIPVIYSFTSKKIIKDKFISAKVGEVVKFGNYDKEQDLEWVVVYDDKEGHLLLLTKQSIAQKPYFTKHQDFSWEDSEIRNWLNHDFYNKTFSEEEKSLISQVTLSTTGGNSTEDKIFLLSEEEAKAILPNESLRELIFTGDEWWWLRSSSWAHDSSYYARAINEAGTSYSYAYAEYSCQNGIHAALWIDTTS